MVVALRLIHAMPSSLAHRLAVCSWSLQPSNPQDLLEKLRATGLHRIQLNLDPLRESPDVWGDFAGFASANGIEVVSGMFGTLGEDYSTLDTIRETGGIVPDAHWEQNLANIRACAGIAASLDLKLVTFHAGFLPHEATDPDYGKLRGRLETVASIFAEKGIALALETGQETAETLRSFLEDLGCPNVGANFDPANMLLYAKGDPIEAMRVLAPWIRQVHIKDAVKTQVPGTWGSEVVAGTGEVDWKAFFGVLTDIGYTGNLCIEREAGSSRVEDIAAARALFESIA
jgi:L-ribulose-5-phosphate 3-epimerase